MEQPAAPGFSHMARTPGHKARRPRAARACDACRLKKNKCDEAGPCSYCKSKGLDCLYQGQPGGRDNTNSQYVRSLEEQVKNLSARLQSHDGPQIRSTVPPSQPVISSPVARHFEPARQSRPSEDVLPGPSAIATPDSTCGFMASEQEVSGVNSHTKNVEFYGSTSSVALLSHVRQDDRVGGTSESSPHNVLLSSLHNSAFLSPGSQQHVPSDAGGGRGQMPQLSQCLNMIQGYFAATHYIHPILDRDEFMKRCECFWSGAMALEGPTSFTALYYSVLSLAALIGPRDEEPIGGFSNMQWSRKFFEVAQSHCNSLGMVTNLDMVQCYFFLAKVCQNELIPHLSYMYVGLAVRTALAMGINRKPGPNHTKDASQLRAETRTWWGLYSFETEMSFAMGRPDTLGADLYHNRPYPVTRSSKSTDSGLTKDFDPPSCDIIEHMVAFSRVTRKVCLNFYLADTPAQETMTLAAQVEGELNVWLRNLPDRIRPRMTPQAPSTLMEARDPLWVKRQRLVLTIRYHNLRILLFGSLLLRTTAQQRSSIPRSQDAIQKCLESATKTIELIYHTYQHNDFFRTWFYNTTYTVFAASIILVYVTRNPSEIETPSLLGYVEMAIEILEIMDECVVALESAKLLRNAMEKAQSTNRTVVSEVTQESSILLNHYWGALDLLEGDMEFDFALQFPDIDGTIPQALG